MSILNNIKMPILPKLFHKTNTTGLPRWCNGENPPAIAGDSGDMYLIPGLGRSPGVGYATHSSILLALKNLPAMSETWV